MKPSKVSLIFILFLSIKLSAQFSFEAFLSEPFDRTISSTKEKLVDKKIEEQEIMNFKTILYYDWIEPVSVKVGFMFTKDGEQIGKVISNGKDNEEDSQKLFDMAKTSLIKKYGSNYLEKSMMGLKMLQWKSIGDCIIMLTLKGGRLMLFLRKF